MLMQWENTNEQKNNNPDVSYWEKNSSLLAFWKDHTLAIGSRRIKAFSRDRLWLDFTLISGFVQFFCGSQLLLRNSPGRCTLPPHLQGIGKAGVESVPWSRPEVEDPSHRNHKELLMRLIFHQHRKLINLMLLFIWFVHWFVVVRWQLWVADV